MRLRFRPDALSPGLALVAAACLFRPVPAAADDAPLSYAVSPGIYKVLNENADYKVILATWPAGARDEFHSHPVAFVTYALTDCSRRFHFTDGKSNDATFKKGTVFLQDPVPSHSFENIGTATCELLLVEKKR